MLLVEENVAKFLPKKNLFSERFLASDFITFEEFTKFNKNFNKRMDDKNHPLDKVEHYFTVDVFTNLFKVTNIKKVAFVFLSRGRKGLLSVAMLGLDDNNDFLFTNAVESNRNGKTPKPLREEDFWKWRDNYQERMADDGLNFDPKNDRGVIHETDMLKGWATSVQNFSVVYFGVQENEFQNVMLVSDKSLDVRPSASTKYAFDRGNGCCPEQ